jgi:hypothetical protein
MWAGKACDALRSRKRLELRYNGFSRIVEVHAVGISKENNPIMRVWQVSGGSESGERTGWKLMRLDEALSAHVTDQESQAPRSGYKRGDAAMRSIQCQL